MKLAAEAKEYTVLREIVDPVTCNPRKAWHDLGEPKNPSNAQVELIRRFAYPFAQSGIAKRARGTIALLVPVRAQGVVYVDITEREFEGDRGFDFDRRF